MTLWSKTEVIFMANFQTIVANLGFPIAISLYLLVRIEGKLQALTDSINELSHNINKMG